MRAIEKVNPFNKDELEYLFSFINLNCQGYKGIDIKTFMECRDSIYITIDKYTRNLTNSYPVVDGIIGCRRIHMDDISIDKLKYYCKPYGIIYSIEFLHYFYKHKNFDMVGNYDPESKALKEMIDTCMHDKNDAFVVYRPKCPTGRTPAEHDILIQLGFYLEDYDKNKEIFTYLRPPKVRG